MLAQPLSLRSPFLALAAAASVTLAGCEQSRSPHVGGGPELFVEAEINDTALLANFIGWVRPGDSFVIHGDLGFGGDFQDGFAFVADVPVVVEYALYAPDPSGFFGVCVYDPYFDQIVFCDTSGDYPETGAFYVGTHDTEFHIFLTHLAGASGYQLVVDVYPLSAAPSEAPAEGDEPTALASHSLEAAHSIQHDAALARRSEAYRGGTGLATEPPAEWVRDGVLFTLDIDSGALGEIPLLRERR